MNRIQKSIVRWSKLEMNMYGISFYKARKKAKSTRKAIGDMLVKKYGFKRK